VKHGCLVRDESGSPAVEFALAAPVLLLLIAAIIELGMIMFVSTLMEGSLREAGRYGITGQVPEDGDRVGYILDMVADRTLGLVDIGKVTLKISAYPTFDDVGKGEDFVDGNGNGKYDHGETFKDCNHNGERDADRGTAGAGGSGDVVLYQLDYDWPLLTSLMRPLIGDGNGKFHIQASTVVRNEPWDANTSGKENANCNL
jgi:Flp pilus assembly protein TadG